MKPEVRMGSQRGFSLIELMVVVVIITILTSVALPSFQAYVMRSKRSVAKSILHQVAARQEQFFMDNRQYATSMVQLGYPANPLYLNQEGDMVTASSTQRVYEISIARPTVRVYTLSATPQLGQASKDSECATFTLTESGVKGVSGSGGAAKCW